jgi:hypothetical protein
MADTTFKTSALKKNAAKPAKTGAVDARAEVKKAATKKTSPAGNSAFAKPAASSTAKKATPGKPAQDKAPAVSTPLSGEQRYRMIAEAAYFRAESRQFQSDPVRDWIEAERDIATLLGEDK